MNQEFSQVFELPFAAKLQLVEDLWDSIAESPEQVPVHDWQKEELAKRKANYLQNPDSGSSWEEAKQRIRNGRLGYRNSNRVIL
jgi:putative addiction module component (TIGR02574 family)